MSPRPAITGYAVAHATARPTREREPAGSVYGPVIADHEIASRRALQTAREGRLYPAHHAATLASSRLGRLGRHLGGRRTGLVLATVAADRHAITRIPQAFVAPRETSSRERRLDVLVAVSRFLSAGLAQDVAATLGVEGPELCLPGDCGVSPLAVASLFIDSGRADAMVVVAVDPQADDAACYEAVAVVIERTADAGHLTPPSPHAALTTGSAACVPAIREYLSRLPAPSDGTGTGADGPADRCAVRWARRAVPVPADASDWLDRGRQLLDDSVRAAGTSDLGLVVASFLDLSPEHALRAIECGGAAHEIVHAACLATFENGLRRHARSLSLQGPYVAVTGIPGASLLALAIAEDMIAVADVPAVIVLAGDWTGKGAARALAALGCPEGPNLRSSVSAVVLERAPRRPSARGMRAFVARRDACDEFGAELGPHAPTHVMVSGCTASDLDMARQAVPLPPSSSIGSGSGSGSGERQQYRFLGADTVVCLADLLALPGPGALLVRNELGGSGLLLLDA